MVRTYKRVSNRCSYSVETLRTALTAIQNGMPKRKASNVYGIPRPTLIKHLSSASTPKLGRFQRVFTDEVECELMMHVVEMQNRSYGLGLTELRRIAFELAEKNGIAHPFSSRTKMAGEDWAAGFLKRNPELSLRRPEPTSLSRLSGFNRVQVSRFFGLLKDQLATKKFLPQQIYNVDESGITTVQNPGKILAKKGYKRVGRVVSGEKGTTTTIVCAMSASGHFIPPMFIFKRKRWTDLLLRNCPTGSIGHPSPNGWIDQDLFITYLQHFVTFSKPCETNPVLLVIDGHQSHKSLRAVEFARKNYITLLTLPPHSSHRLQPLDVTFFGPLKKAVNAEMDKWMLTHAATRITDYDLCGIFAPAYQRVANVDKAVNGFAASGIWPYNPEKFGDEDFAPSTVTELPICGGQKDGQAENDRPTASTSTGSSTGAHYVRVTDISPLPQMKGTDTGKRKRKAEAAEVITSSPYQKALKDKEAVKKTPKGITGSTVSSRKRLLTDSSTSQAEHTQAGPKAKVESRRSKRGKRAASSKSSRNVQSSSSPHCSRKRSSTKLPVMTRPRPLDQQPPLPRRPKWLQKNISE